MVDSYLHCLAYLLVHVVFAFHYITENKAQLKSL